MVSLKDKKSFADNLKSNKSTYEDLWARVSEIMGDGSFDRLNDDYTSRNDDSADEITYDPAIRRIRNTVSDYYLGMIFPLKNPFSLLSPIEKGYQKSWYDQQSDKIISYLQSNESGFYENAGPFFQDWTTYGNAAFGVFETGNKETPYFIKEFGIDTMSIAEGKNGSPNYFAYHDQYYAGDLIETFGREKVSDVVCASFDSGENSLFKVTCLIIPNSSFDKEATAGSKSSKYSGYWFIEDSNDPVLVEDYKEKPVAFTRQIKTRGQIYGKSEISQNVGSIETINASIWTTILNMKNTAMPPLGMYSNSVLNSNELDNTSGGITIFNQDVMLNGATPIFPIVEQGNVSPLFSVLTTYLKDEILKLNRMDLIIDLEQRTNMTATEFLRRLALKGDALGAVLLRLLNQLEPFFERIINISVRAGLVDMDTAPEDIKKLYKEGKKWYKIGYNNSIHSLLDGATQSDLLNSINLVAASNSVDPSVSADVDMYSVLKNQFGNGILGSALTSTIAEHEEKKAGIMQIQKDKAESEIGVNVGKANKDNAQANNAYSRER